MVMDASNILLAINEYKQWNKRKEKLKNEIVNCSPEEKIQKQKDIAKIEYQILYYHALLKDIKKTIRPSRLSDLLRAINE